MTTYQDKVKTLRAHHEELLTRKNEPVECGNGIYDKYKYPILTAEHTPLEWRYDFNEKDNPYLMQRIMMNATLNSGAIKWNGKYLLVVRVAGADRKSFLLWQKVLMVWTTSASGMSLSLCRRMWYLQQISMTCA
mgnify:CR=1 FL=1